MTEASQPVRFNDEQTATANFRDSVQLAGLADLVRPKGPAPRGPQVLFVLSTNETFEVDAPDDFIGPHEVQRRKRNGDGGGPALRSDARLGNPHAVPTLVSIAA